MKNDKICDCNQGRLPCSCKPRDIYGDGAANFEESIDVLCSRRKIGMPPEMAMPYGREADTYAVNVAMRRGKQISDQLMHIDTLNVRLKVYQGVAIIGWAAAILLALGV